MDGQEDVECAFDEPNALPLRSPHPSPARCAHRGRPGRVSADATGTRQSRTRTGEEGGFPLLQRADSLLFRDGAKSWRTSDSGGPVPSIRALAAAHGGVG